MLMLKPKPDGLDGERIGHVWKDYRKATGELLLLHRF